jgi:hypothetical protein
MLAWLDKEGTISEGRWCILRTADIPISQLFPAPLPQYRFVQSIYQVMISTSTGQRDMCCARVADSKLPLFLMAIHALEALSVNCFVRGQVTATWDVHVSET